MGEMKTTVVERTEQPTPRKEKRKRYWYIKEEPNNDVAMDEPVQKHPFVSLPM